MRGRRVSRRFHSALDRLESREAPSSLSGGAALGEAISMAVRAMAKPQHGLALDRLHLGLHGANGVPHARKKTRTGPPGPQGPQGPTGPQGLQGPAGPSGRVISYNLAAGGNSSPITVAADRPVLVIATNTTNGDRGTGQIDLEHATSSFTGPFLEWAGYNATTGVNTPPTLTGGFTGAAGTNMLKFDFNGQVTLQVADGDHFVIHNGSGQAQTGLIWILEAPV